MLEPVAVRIVLDACVGADSEELAMDLSRPDSIAPTSLAVMARELQRLRRFTFVLAALLVGVLFTALARPPAAARAKGRAEEFEEITVGRINVIEPDGTVRLVISNRSQFPGDWYQGTENARPDRRSVAGMLFVNDDGTENGGLIQHGKVDARGVVDASLSLTFDRFRQDQVLQLIHAEHGGATRTGVIINDRPDPRSFSIHDLKEAIAQTELLPAAEREARFAALRDEGKLGQQRAYLGTTSDRGSALMLSDAKGRARLLLLVPAQGQPVLQLLDEQGQVSGTLAVTPAGGGK